MIWKELTARINRENAILEYKVEETKERIDVLFKLNNKKIGVEIQTSPIPFDVLQNKAGILKEKCNHWFVIFPKKIVNRYIDQYPCNVVTLKEAIDEIKKIANTGEIKEKYHGSDFQRLLAETKKLRINKESDPVEKVMKTLKKARKKNPKNKK